MPNLFMAIWKKKNDGYVDLTEKMKKKQERVENFQSNVSEPKVQEETPNSNGNGFLGGFFGGGSSSTPIETNTESSDEKRKKLAKRLMEITSRMESMENEIYHLKQKLEVLEKKQRLGY